MQIHTQTNHFLSYNPPYSRGNIPFLFKPDWLNSPMLKTHRVKPLCLKTPSEQFSTLSKSDWLIIMEPRNLIGWTLRCLEPHWVKPPCFKTPSEQFSTLSKFDWLIAMEPRYLIGWIRRWLKLHWVNSPYAITYGRAMFKLSYTLVNDFTKIDVLLTLRTDKQSDTFFARLFSIREREQIFPCYYEMIMLRKRT